MKADADPRARGAWALAGFCAFALCFAFVLKDNARFFYFDDVEHELLPLIRAIGHDVGLFDWPALTLRSWSAGYLSAEQVFGLYNPLNRLLYHWMAGQDDMAMASAVFALANLSLLYLGTWLATRAYGARPEAAAVAAFAMATNNLIVYWFASSWWNIVASLAWFPFVIWARTAAARPILRFAGVVVFGYLVLTSSAVHTTIATAVFLALHDGLAWRRREPRLAASIGVLGLAVALLLAAPAWMPLVDYLPSTVRGTFREAPDAWSASLGDLLQFANPLYYPNIVVFDVYRRIGAPLYYIAWFATTLLILAPLDRWKRLIAEQPVLPIAALLFFFASQGPAMIGPSRFAFRFIPFFAFSLVILTCRVAGRDSDPQRARRREWAALGVAVFGVIQLLQRSGTIEVLALALWLVAIVALVVRRAATPPRLWAFCLLGSMCFFVTTHSVTSWNNNLSYWQSPDHVRQWRQAPVAPHSDSDYTAYVVPAAWMRDDGFFDELSTGNTGLNTGRNLVFGYSPTGHWRLNRPFCLGMFGWTCDRAVSQLVAIDEATGLRFYDLMHVREIVMSSRVASGTRALVPVGDWEEDADPARKLSVRWTRRAPPDLHGSIASVPARTGLSATTPLSAEHESWAVAGDGDAGPLVFARLFLTGFKITLDGQPLETYPHAGFLLGAKLPARARGTLELRFVEPTYGRSHALVALGLVLFAAVATALVRRRPAFGQRASDIR